MDVLRTWCSRKLTTSCLGILQELQALSDGNIAGIELCCTGVCIDGVGNLVVATLVQTSKIKPDFGDIWIDADSTRVSIESVTVLVDLKIEYTDGAPEGRITTVPVDRLLVSFVSLVVLLTSHISTTKKIPTLSIGRISFEGLGEVLNSDIMVLEGGSILMVKPTKLLEDFGMLGICLNDAFISVSRAAVVLLLFENMPDLEPDVGMSQRTWGIAKNAIKACKGVFKFTLLLVNNA
jgi:hypothetical protein